MPAPAVYVLAVVGTIGAVYAFHHFVYEPHLAPKLEQLAEEFVARRRARRMQRQGPIPVPVDIPLRRRQGSHSSKRSDTTLSDSDSDSKPNEHKPGPSGRQGSSSIPSKSRRTNRDPDFDESVAHEVSEWRTEVGRSQLRGNLRHRTNISVHAMDESITPIPHLTMSPTHVIVDTSAPTTPTTTTVPSRISSPPAHVSPLLPTGNESTLRSSPSGSAVLPLRPSPLSQSRAPLPTIPPFAITPTTPTQASTVFPSAASPNAGHYSFSSSIPSLSQSYPEELDRERGVELLSPPSSGTSSPFTTFSPLVASQVLSPLVVVQPLDSNTSSEAHPGSPYFNGRMSAPSQDTLTDATASVYRSLPVSPAPATSELSPPSLVEPAHRFDSNPINFTTSPNALSPRSPHTDLSDLDFESDIDVVSDPGSDGSDHSWAGISTASGSSNAR